MVKIRIVKSSYDDDIFLNGPESNFFSLINTARTLYNSVSLSDKNVIIWVNDRLYTGFPNLQEILEMAENMSYLPKKLRMLLVDHYEVESVAFYGHDSSDLSKKGLIAIKVNAWIPALNGLFEKVRDLYNPPDCIFPTKVVIAKKLPPSAPLESWVAYEHFFSHKLPYLRYECWRNNIEFLSANTCDTDSKDIKRRYYLYGKSTKDTGEIARIIRSLYSDRKTNPFDDGFIDICIGDPPDGYVDLYREKKYR